jgi:flavin reductase (DIM6/NTAB) family NADH-FMN oxidoreductase RutF
VDGVDHAMTANSFTSLSLDPLLVLVSVERDSRFHEAIMHSDDWGVSILPASAEAVSRWFATEGRPLDGQFDTVPHTRGVTTDAALITGALATLECRTHAIHPGGDHDLVIGDVAAVQVEDHQLPEPLLYYQRGYRRMSDLA